MACSMSSPFLIWMNRDAHGVYGRSLLATQDAGQLNAWIDQRTSQELQQERLGRKGNSYRVAIYMRSLARGQLPWFLQFSIFCGWHSLAQVAPQGLRSELRVGIMMRLERQRARALLRRGRDFCTAKIKVGGTKTIYRVKVIELALKCRHLLMTTPPAAFRCRPYH